MIYRIESKSDLTGAMLVIRFPEEDLDAKALYTIQADQPDFLVPFRYRCVDGEAECTYQLGNRVKLLYLCSSKSAGALTGFWEQVLQPLLDCGDWFLNPFSFVLDPQYLYTDREGRTVSYLYVPSKRPCGDMNTLQKLASDLAQKNPATDAKLEVEVLRAIMQDFQPRSFLQMLRKNGHAGVIVPLPAGEEVPSAPEEKPSPSASKEAEVQPPAPKEPVGSRMPEDGDIQIDLSGGGKEKKKGLFGRKEEKKKKPKKEGGLFGKKKEEPKELVLGAAAKAPSAEPGFSPFPPKHDTEGPGLTEEDGETELFEETYFRLVGDQTLPRKILVDLQTDGVFTIGRYDVTIGRRQSDFEFEAKTKAVSRHHAAVERTTDGYRITDLNSAAGTFVNGERLTPNVPRALAQGCRVSFGTAGADYIWEE